MTDTLRTYASTWLETIKPTVRPNTIRAYEQALRIRILPFLGDTSLQTLSRPQLKAWFLGPMARYKPATAHHALIALHSLLAAAVEDEVLDRNPAGSLRKALRGTLRDRRRGRRPPLTREQLAAFLDAARADPETYPMLVLLAYTGLRLGEAVGLQWADVDFSRGSIRIERQVHPYGEIAPVKSIAGAATIPLADELRRVLWTLKTERAALREKWDIPDTPWVLYPDLFRGTTPHQARKRLSAAVKRALSRAGLPLTFSCHSMRHTIATILLEEGADLKFVQNLLRHSSISITADGYGWAAKMREGVVDLLDRAVKGTKVPGTNGLLTPPEKNA